MNRIGVILRIFVIVCFFLLLGIGCTSGATLVVNQMSPACTKGDFYYNTIQEAVDKAVDGDTIIVCPGTYIENIKVGKSLTIQSKNCPDSTIVQAKDPKNHVFNVTADYVKISGFTVERAFEWGWYAGINLYNADYCNISNNNCHHNWISIDLKKSNNNNISNNNCDNLWDCIHLYGSNNNSILNNNCPHSVRGIELGYSNNNSILNNNCSSNVDESIYIKSSNNNSILNNNCSSTTEESIILIDSNNNSISNNKCSNNEDGICMISSSNNAIKNNLITLNDHDGIRLSNCYKNTIEENIISDNELFTVSLNNCSSNTIRNNTIKSNFKGISLSLSNKNIVEGNSVSENTYFGINLNKSHDNIIKNNDAKLNDISGIMLHYSNNNKIEKNTASDSLWGISVECSNDNVIKDNILKSNSVKGIYLSLSNKNTIEKNVVSDNFRGIDLILRSSNNVIKNNIVKSNTVFGIRLIDSNDNIVEGDIAFDNDHGIVLINSNRDIIRDNIIKSNEGGVYLDSSNFTLIKNNDISINGYGVILESNGSLIYHNNIIDNQVMEIFDLLPETRNYWYNYSSLEGNYWSDYEGADDGSDIDKHSIAGDGIGDTETPHPDPGYDEYPFINKSGWLTFLVSPEYWDFGAVYQGDVKPKQTFEIQNKGKDVLTIFDIASDKEVNISGTEFPTTISGGRSKTFNVVIDTENLEGDILRGIEIISNDRITPNKTILMFGFVEMPPHRVEIESINYGSPIIKGQTNLFSVGVNNSGVTKETNISVNFIVGDKILNSKEIPELKKGKTKTVKFKWDTNNVSLGIHKIAIEVRLPNNELLDSIKGKVNVLPASKATTLIITNSGRMNEVWRNRKVEEKLIELSLHPSVDGIIVRVENETNNSERYKKWDKDKTPEKANEIAETIKHLIDSKLKEYPNIEYLIIVGDDRIIPFYRIKDNTKKSHIGPDWKDELDYFNGSHISNRSAVGLALSQGYYFTDDFYADFEQELLPINVHVPEKPIGRLVESPEEIISLIDTFLTTYDVYPKSIFVTGCGFMSDGCMSSVHAWGDVKKPVFMVNSPNEVNYNSSEEIKDEILNKSNTVMAIFQHADYSGFTNIPGGKNVSDPCDLTASVVSNSTRIEGAIVYAMSCHSGLNVPPEESNSLDLVQSFIKKGVLAYVAPTGYGMGGLVTVAGHEKLLKYFTEQLCNGKEVGDALISAKSDYYLNNFHMDYLDEKVVSSTVLYGLPMYRLSKETGVEEERVQIMGTNQKEAIHGMQMEELEIYTLTLRPKLKPEENSSESGKPILPMTTWPYVIDKDKIHGITLDSAEYDFAEDVIRVIETFALSDDTEAPDYDNKDWYPSQFFKINTVGEMQKMVVVTGQFKMNYQVSLTAYNGSERQFRELSFDIYLSPIKAEEEKPVINRVECPKKGNATYVRINATDNSSGVLKVIATYTDRNSNNREWVSVDAEEDAQKPNEYYCTLKGDVEFFVQAVDIHGNVAIKDNNGQYYPEIGGGPGLS